MSLYQTFDKAEAALRDYAEAIILGPSDDEIVETLAEYGIHACIYGCTVKRRPFARTARAA